ncbi:MAG: hypothetical protein NTY53_24175 [Kiritimatiellaeota bacterium]|nr:hypothetical protein [Kiritimatiellota bacterium]
MTTQNSWVKIRERRYAWQDKTTGKSKTGKSWMVDARLINGERLQRTFRDKREANALLEQLKAERRVEEKNRAVSMVNLTDDQRMEVLQAYQLLNGKASLLDAVNFFVEHLFSEKGEPLPQITVREAVEKYVANRTEKQLRERSLRDLRVRLARFVTMFGDKPVAAVTRFAAQDWLDGLRHGPTGKRHYSGLSLRNYRVCVGGLFNWLTKRGYFKINPIAHQPKSSH